MKINEVTPTEYKNTIVNPFSIFDTVDFSLINAKKMESLKYLIFNDGKNRFGLICGVKDGIIKAPFSAPYACLSEASKDNKMLAYHTAIKELVSYAKSSGLRKIRVTLPPTVYNESHIAKIYNSFYVAGFHIAGCDLNYQYSLQKFDSNYEMNIDPKARQKLRTSLKYDLQFCKTDDIQAAYFVIQENRKAKQYPLWMSLDDIKNTIKIVKCDFFLVSHLGALVASAMVYHITTDKVQVIYWGNLPGTDDLKSMNFLSFKIFEYYKSQNVSFLDIGPSTENSMPNFGLCDFKQGIGCDVSSKLTFELDLS